MLSLGFAFYFVNERASTAAENELRRGLEEAGTLVDQHAATRTDHYTRLTRVVADLPKLKAAVETGDAPTVQPLADEYREEGGRRSSDPDRPERRGARRRGPERGRHPGALAESPLESEDEISAFLPHRRGLLQVVSAPIFLEGPGPDILGRLTVGVLLDDRLASEQFKKLTGSEIAFAARGNILASTLPRLHVRFSRGDRFALARLRSPR